MSGLYLPGKQGRHASAFSLSMSPRVDRPLSQSSQLKEAGAFAYEFARHDRQDEDGAGLYRPFLQAEQFSILCRAVAPSVDLPALHFLQDELDDPLTSR